MTTIDITILVVYLVGLFCWAIYIGFRQTAEDFFVFSRRAPFLLVLFSIVATWVGVGTTLVTAASGYEKGISLGLTACVGGILGAMGASWFAPKLKAFGDEFKAYTIGDFFGVRYSRTSRFVSSGMILLIYVLLTAAQFVGLATLLKVWTGTSITTLIVFAAISTIIYTAFAGIKSDFYTDFVHFLVMFTVLFLVLLPQTLQDIGGMSALAALPSSYFDPFAYGGVPFFIAGIIFGAGSVFVTMELWQRVYASSSGRSAQIALVVSIIIIVLFYAVSTLLGMSAKILLPNLPDRDLALFALMKYQLPTGLLGFGLAGFIAICISTINSTLMVGSATLTKDVWAELCRTKQNDQKLLLAGRISTFVIGAGALIIAYVFPDLVALSVNGMFMLLILLPAIAGGFFWERATSTAAWLSIISGGVVTACFIPINPDISFVPGFFASLLVFIIASLRTSHTSEENIAIVARWKNYKQKFQ